MVIMILSYEPSISLHGQMQRTRLVIPDMDSRMNCSANTEMQRFYKLYTAARLLH